MADGSWSGLTRRVRAMHNLWQQVLQDMTVEQVNHHERAGVLPIAFSLYHYVNGEDRNVAERLLGNQPPIWTDEWAERTGIHSEPIRRGAPIEVAEQVRVVDLDAWRAYQTEVFARTEATLSATPESRWEDVVYERVPDASRGGFIGLLAGDGPVLLGDLMDVFLYQHGMRHLGEIEHARSLVGLQGVG
jgi:hypothetical protein